MSSEYKRDGFRRSKLSADRKIRDLYKIRRTLCAFDARSVRDNGTGIGPVHFSSFNTGDGQNRQWRQ